MKQLLITKFANAKAKFKEFVKEERSARGFSEEGWLTYGAIVLGIIILLITSQFMDITFNDIGNFFSDGVNGTVDETGLNEWGDQTDGFNQE